MPEIVACTRQDAREILEILNEAILNTTALYEYAPRPLSSMDSWFAAKEQGKHPVIGVRAASGELLAFGTYGSFRAWPAYKYSVEHSLYVRADQRRQGLGRLVLARIEDAARKQGYHTLIAGIDSANRASITLHLAGGFEACGVIKHAGFKFGRWLDLAFYQKILAGPENPRDG